MGHDNKHNNENESTQEDVQVAYFERLYNAGVSDAVLAKMWQIDPATMSRLMPGIGNETTEEIESEVSRPQAYLDFAINSVRVFLGKDIKLTNRQIMRDAKYDYDNRA